MTNLRINIGCGRRPTEGWRNFDNSPTLRLAAIPLLPGLLRKLGLLDQARLEFVRTARERRIEYCDGGGRLPLENGSAKAVYSSHMLEHLPPEEAASFLREAKRVLSAGGIIRLAVPDLSVLARNYAGTGDADAFVAATRLAETRGKKLPGPLRVLTEDRGRHRWMYDGPSLCRLLARTGFVDARILPPGRTAIPNPGALDLRERESESVYVEAVKPPAPAHYPSPKRCFVK